MKSLIYIVSVALLTLSFLLFPKSEKKLGLLQWLAITLFGYELFACFSGAVLTAIQIPAEIGSIAIVNCLTGASLLWGIRKKGAVQQYTLSAWEAIGLFIMAAAILCLGYYRFEGFKTINYATSDPGVHLRMAMDCVNNATASSDESGMIVSQFTNALWIEWLMPLFPGANRYRSFMLKDVYNYFLAGFVFYAAFRPKKHKGASWQVYLVTVAYIAGYPLSNLLFGFQYLGLGITAVCYLVLCTHLYRSEEVAKSWIVCLMNLGCLGVSLSYTLFAPVVYIALFIFVAWDYVTKNAEKKINWRACCSIAKLELAVFLVPTLLTVYYIIIVQIIKLMGQQNNLSLGTALTWEGYIFRNLYSDFIIILPFTIYGWWTTVKERNMELLTFLLPLEVIYTSYFFVKMINGEVSTYYYYKLNFLNSLVLYGMGAVGVANLCKKAMVVVTSYIITWLAVFGVWCCGTTYTLNLENVLYSPFTDDAYGFQIYNHNKILLSSVENNPAWVPLATAMTEIGEKDLTNLFLGDWLSSYWYEALTDEEISQEYAYKIGAAQVLNKFLNDESYGDYMAVLSGSEEEAEIQKQLQELEVVFECEGGYIVKRNLN